MCEIWKEKYEKLKADNDRKTMKLASLATSSVLANKSMNRENSMSTIPLSRNSSKKSF